MNKQEFMQLLEQRIKLLPLSERHRLINFYNEALEDRIEEGMSEEDAVASLDGLDELSLNLYDEIKEEPIEKDKRTNITNLADDSRYTFDSLVGMGLIAGDLACFWPLLFDYGGLRILLDAKCI